MRDLLNQLVSLVEGATTEITIPEVKGDSVNRISRMDFIIYRLANEIAGDVSLIQNPGYSEFVMALDYLYGKYITVEDFHNETNLIESNLDKIVNGRKKIRSLSTFGRFINQMVDEIFDPVVLTTLNW